MTGSRRGRAWKPNRTGKRCTRTRDGHAEPADASSRAAANRPVRQVEVPPGRGPRHHGAHVDRVTDPAPYDGQPFAPIGALSAAEHAWGRGLVQRGWP